MTSSSLTSEARYEFFPHQADVGIRGIGQNAAEAFEQAALALTGIAVEPEKIQDREKVLIHCQAPSLGLLFVDWLNALIYEANIHKAVFGHFQVRLVNHRLEGIAWGEKVDRERHEFTVEAKGATYTQLAVEKQADGHWIAQCVIDV